MTTPADIYGAIQERALRAGLPIAIAATVPVQASPEWSSDPT